MPFMEIQTRTCPKYGREPVRRCAFICGVPSSESDAFAEDGILAGPGQAMPSLQPEGAGVPTNPNSCR